MGTISFLPLYKVFCIYFNCSHLNIFLISLFIIFKTHEKNEFLIRFKLNRRTVEHTCMLIVSSDILVNDFCLLSVADQNVYHKRLM